MLDKILSTLAPFQCLSCQNKGYLLCPACQLTALETAPSRCYRCHRLTTQFSVCKKCYNKVRIKRLFAVTPYKGLAKDLLECVKFQRAKAGTNDIARILSDSLPIFDPNTLVCHVSTANTRIRVRGYDQSELIAKRLAKLSGLPYQRLILRSGNSRQLGATRSERFKQAELSFRLNPKASFEGQTVLLVDDVTTSGATMEAIAKLLKEAGVKEVNAVVFAQAID